MKYFGKYVPIYLSNRKDKKYMLRDENGKLIHFGAYGMEDYTKHKDPVRRERYLKRATKIKGHWKDDKYSANNLSLYLLWDY
jgi:hypothetical protein